MALYVIASLITCTVESVPLIKPYMQAVVTNVPESEVDSIEIFKKTFEDGKEAEEGWKLVGEPLLLEFHQGHFAEWGQWISPAPVQVVHQTKIPHLRLVKE